MFSGHSQDFSMTFSGCYDGSCGPVGSGGSFGSYGHWYFFPSCPLKCINWIWESLIILSQMRTLSCFVVTNIFMRKRRQKPAELAATGAKEAGTGGSRRLHDPIVPISSNLLSRKLLAWHCRLVPALSRVFQINGVWEMLISSFSSES